MTDDIKKLIEDARADGRDVPAIIEELLLAMCAKIDHPKE